MALQQIYLDDNKTLIKSYSDAGKYIQSNNGDFYAEAIDMACFILNGERKYTESVIDLPRDVEVEDENGETHFESVDSDSILAATESLENIKQLKLNNFKALRDTEEIMPIEYSGKFFDYDDKAMARISNAIIVLDLQGEGAFLEWTCADNSVMQVTALDLRSIIARVAVRSNMLHEKYRELKERVLGCESIEDVMAITWSDVNFNL